MTLDQATELFEADPSGKNAGTLRAVAYNYFTDGMIGDEEFDAIEESIKRVIAANSQFGLGA